MTELSDSSQTLFDNLMGCTACGETRRKEDTGVDEGADHEVDFRPYSSSIRCVAVVTPSLHGLFKRNPLLF